MGIADYVPYCNVTLKNKKPRREWKISLRCHSRFNFRVPIAKAQKLSNNKVTVMDATIMKANVLTATNKFRETGHDIYLFSLWGKV